MTLTSVMKTLRALGSKKNREGMKRYNIGPVKSFGVNAPNIRTLARTIKKDHALAIELWKTEYQEARILAALIADPEKTGLPLMDRWVNSMHNWAQCDCCCMELFEKTTYAYDLPARWSNNEHEFVRRAGIVMIAVLAVHHKKTSDEEFEKFFPLLKRYSTDDRNFVKKAVNWAVRQIGKRNLRLHKKAIALAKEIQNIPSPAAKWIAADALREFRNPKIVAAIKNKKGAV